MGAGGGMAGRAYHARRRKGPGLEAPNFVDAIRRTARVGLTATPAVRRPQKRS